MQLLNMSNKELGLMFINYLYVIVAVLVCEFVIN